MGREENNKTNIVEDILKKNNYTTLREVIPNECKRWNKPFRVDLIFYKDPQNATGVEFKDASFRSGGKIAEAYLQIRKYRIRTYDKIKVTKWCICPSFNNPTDEAYGDRMTGVILIEFLKGFLNKLNVSFMWFDEDTIIIDSMTKNKITIQK